LRGSKKKKVKRGSQPKNRNPEIPQIPGEMGKRGQRKAKGEKKPGGLHQEQKKKKPKNRPQGEKVFTIFHNPKTFLGREKGTRKGKKGS